MDAAERPLRIESIVSRRTLPGDGLMLHIVVDEQQAKIISEATEGVEIRDPRGRHLGYVAHGFSSEDIAIAKHRLASDEPRHTTKEVLAHLRSMEPE
jgi:hypothetical protein